MLVALKCTSPIRIASVTVIIITALFVRTSTATTTPITNSTTAAATTTTVTTTANVTTYASVAANTTPAAITTAATNVTFTGTTSSTNTTLTTVNVGTAFNGSTGNNVSIFQGLVNLTTPASSSIRANTTISTLKAPATSAATSTAFNPFSALLTTTTTSTTIGPLKPRNIPRDNHYIGCFIKILGETVPPNTLTSMNMFQSVRQRPNITDCLNACSSYSDMALHTFAAWIPREPLRDVFGCYCFEQDFLKLLVPAALDNCKLGYVKDDYLLIYSVCPRGSFPPPTCPSLCPNYCLPVQNSYETFMENICSKYGSCIFGCKKNTCLSISVCQIASGLTGLHPYPNRYEMIPLDSSMYLLFNLEVLFQGNVSQISFGARGGGLAYVGFWRKSKSQNGFQWILQEKVAITRGSSSYSDITTVTLMGNNQIRVQKGDMISIQQDAQSIGTFSDKRLQMFYTVANVFQLQPSGKNFAFYGKDPMYGDYAYIKDLYDDNWRSGYAIPDSQFHYSTGESNPLKLFVDLNVTIECECKGNCDGFNCLLNRQCDQCTPGYYGPDCKPCPSGRFGFQCLQSCSNCLDQSCDQMTGLCYQGCANDVVGIFCDQICPIGLYGPKCSLQCNPNCVNSTCTSHGCQCIAGFQAPWCNTTCRKGYYGNCNTKCGRCLNSLPCLVDSALCPDNACDPGYKAPLCQDICDNGFYGASCLKKCGGCLTGTTCHVVTGQCLGGCEAGYKEPYCGKNCLTGFYGPKCEHICDYCHKKNCEDNKGRCNGPCASGLTGAFCTDHCQAGFWGVECKLSCGECINNGTCDIYTGKCPKEKGVCEQGYFGEQCLIPCGYCGDNATCDTITGVCPGDCSDPELTKPLCSRLGIVAGTCFPTYYGNGCRNKCGKCLKSLACDDKTGQCPAGCATGYQPPLCQNICGNHTYGDQCAFQCGQCFGGDECNNINGACSQCNDGYQLPYCEEKCKAGMFGPGCMIACGQCQDGGVCDPITGECPLGCQEGYIGRMCLLAIPIDPVIKVLGAARDAKRAMSSTSSIALPVPGVYIVCILSFFLHGIYLKTL